MNKSDKSRNLTKVIIILILVVVFLAAVLLIGISEINKGADVLSSSNEQSETDKSPEIKSENIVYYTEDSSGYEIFPNERGIPVADIDVDFEELKRLNNDVCGYIYIPDTGINCGIVCDNNDPDYYLLNDINNIDGVFMQSYNSSDFSDRMTVIYGKNQNGKSQFEGLKKFKDKLFYKNHKYIFVSTGDKNLTYKIFAAHRAYAEHLMVGYDWSVDQVFIDYLILLLQGNGVDEHANLDSDAEITINDKVITLSDRIEGEDEYRYLVQGVLINESLKENP